MSLERIKDNQLSKIASYTEINFCRSFDWKVFNNHETLAGSLVL